MRTTTAVLLSVFCLMPLAAEDLAGRNIELGAEYQDGIVKGWYFDQIFSMEWDYAIDTGFTDSIRLSWPIMRDWQNPFRFMFEARPEMWLDNTSRRMGNEPDRPGKYFAGFQYLNERIDLRALYPLLYMVEGEKLRPYAELKYLHLFDLECDVDVFARAWTDLSSSSFSLGASKRFGSLELKGYYVDFDSFSWSVGFSTSLN